MCWVTAPQSPSETGRRLTALLGTVGSRPRDMQPEISEWKTELICTYHSVCTHIMLFGENSNNARREGGRKSLWMAEEQAGAW